MNGWPGSTKKALPSSGGSSRRTNAMVGGDAGRHPLLDRGEIVRLERPIELEVVVEAVGDRRADAELRAGEQVEDRLGHDVGGRMAHRVEGIAGDGVEQLLRRPALGRGELLRRRHRPDRGTAPPCPCFFASAIAAPSREITEPLARAGREVDPPAVPPAFAAPWPRTHVPRYRADPGPVHRSLTGGASSPVAAGLAACDPALWTPSRRACPGRCVYVVGDTGLEPVTSCMSSMRSNQLS